MESGRAWGKLGDRAGVAQLAEQPPCKRQVGGSIPPAGSIRLENEPYRLSWASVAASLVRL